MMSKQNIADLKWITLRPDQTNTISGISRGDVGSAGDLSDSSIALLLITKSFFNIRFIKALF